MSTPEQMLREFNQRAYIYRTGLRSRTDDQENVTLKELMQSLKDEWNVKNKELYNEQGSVIFNSYL
jgi:hypothetical protein